MSIVKIALTGGIASGKTYASNFLCKSGIKIIDLDIIANQIIQQPKNIHKLQKLFGNQIISNHQLDKIKLRRMVFSDMLKLKQLEDFLHPKIIKQMQADIKKINACFVVIIVPLLLEKQLFRYFDKSIVIICQQKIQLKRLLQRKNMNKNLANNILKNQANNHQRKQISNYLPTIFIENNGNLIDFKHKLKHLKL